MKFHSFKSPVVNLIYPLLCAIGISAYIRLGTSTYSASIAKTVANCQQQLLPLANIDIRCLLMFSVRNSFVGQEL
jgi:hypothetical protein